MVPRMAAIWFASLTTAQGCECAGPVYLRVFFRRILIRDLGTNRQIYGTTADSAALSLIPEPSTTV